ncbi:MAG: aldehyde dehydrogenase family protein [Phycisphaerales bacterium]
MQRATLALPASDDIAWIARFRRAVAGELTPLCELIQEELGRGKFESMTSDIVPFLSACRWTERHSKKILASKKLPGRTIWQLGQRHRVDRAPLGDVGIIATWNYPIQLLGVQLIHAIAGGNRVLVKPSERSPKTQIRLLELAREAGLGANRLDWTAATREAGESMLRAHRFDHVVFTGSTQVGRVIAGHLSQTLTPSTLELSGCDSALVLSDADVDLAADAIGFALLLNSGRTCMAPRRVIVNRSVSNDLIQALERSLSRPELPPPFDDFGDPAISDLVQSAIADGGQEIGHSRHMRARVVANCSRSAELAKGEHFGAALGVLSVDSDEEVFSMHQAFRQRLATSVFSRRLANRMGLVTSCGSGIVTVNDCVIPTGHPGVGIGGIGESGWGVSRGAEGLLSMTRSVYVSKTGSRVRVPTQPPGERAQRGIERFVRRRYG